MVNRRTDPVLREEFIWWFRDLIRRHGLTQDAAARVVGVHSKMVQKWAGETQRGLPSYPSLVEIVRTFHELPPALEEAFLAGLDETPGHEAQGEDTSGTSDGLEPRPTAVRASPTGPARDRTR